jgi:hypothetical protein
MSKSKWQEYREKNGVTPLDMLNPMTKHIGVELSEERMEICRSCPELIKLTSQCKKCGCFMSIKTRYEAAKCPLGKW